MRISINCFNHSRSFHSNPLKLLNRNVSPAHSPYSHQLVRLMANKEQKNKDKLNMKKKKEKSAASKAHADINEEDSEFPAAALNAFKNYQSKLDGFISQYSAELSEIRVGRLNPEILDNILVKIKNESFPLSELASISSKNASTLLVNVFDSKNLGDVEKALLANNKSNWTISSEGANNISVTVAKNTADSKDNLSREIQKKCENHKQNIRAQRQNTLQAVKSTKMSEDVDRKFKMNIQGLLDGTVAELEKLLKAKQQEINKA
jgi:ribosome recycling factor